MKNGGDALEQIRGMAAPGNQNASRAKQIAEGIRSTHGYRWVGIYEVTDTEIAAIAWTGTEAPAYPRFPITQGLCGAAVESRAPIVVGNVQDDPRYLTTFGSTRSEMVMPIIDAGRVVGLIDVESEHLDAFGDEDTRFLQGCASEILPMFR
jgi:L-methionine (R)-S-oxide reductase